MNGRDGEARRGENKGQAGGQARQAASIVSMQRTLHNTDS